MQSAEKELDLNTLENLFQKSADALFQQYTFNDHKITFIICDAMIDQQLLNEVVVKRVELFMNELKDTTIDKDILVQLHLPGFKQVNDVKDVISLVYNGHVLLYFEDVGILISSNIARKPNRSPEDTKLEAPIMGPRDNFIEDISVNIALIRKRLPTNSLCVEKFELGQRSQTKVALLYFDDIASKEILYAIQKKLEKVDTDIVVSGESLMEVVNKGGNLFPRNGYTGRPDKAVQSLIRGRFLILVDGIAYAIITPINLFLLLKSEEDTEISIVFSSLERLLRVLGMSIGILLPAFWLALTTFHQGQLPYQLLATVVQANTGLPLPSLLEMLVMLAMFELFRESALRLPSALGGTIGVVGGLIIGDAAIRSGITSPSMLVIIAVSTIATFTLVNQSLVTAVSVLRIGFILLTALLGLFGFYMSLFLTVLYLSNIRVFGVPYMNVLTDLSWDTIMRTFLRLPPDAYKERPNEVSPVDKTRTGEG